MFLYITSPFGMGKVLAGELRFLGMKCVDTFESGTFCEATREEVARINLWSRIAHRVYAGLAVGRCENFDQLFVLVSKIDWAEYIPSWASIEIQVQTHQSVLNAGRTIQSIAHKAVLTSLGSQDYVINPKEEKVVILISLLRDIAKIFVDTSGVPLHERGYRADTGQAPIKENLAAGLVLLSRWLFKKPLRDPMCGSGTICIEAAMIGRNIAPWLKRTFLCEKFNCINPQVFSKLREDAQAQIFQDKKYDIIWSDNDEKAISNAQNNATRAWVADTITFKKQDFLSQDKWMDFAGWLITNPPYNERMKQSELINIYNKLNTMFDKDEVQGGYITSIVDINPSIKLKNKFIKNGGIECDFWYK